MSIIVADKVSLLDKQIKNLKKGKKLLLNYCGNGHSFVANVVFDKTTKEENSCQVKITKVISYLGNLNFSPGDCVLVHFSELTLP